MVAVKCSKVDDHVAFAYKFLQFILVIEVIILERYSYHLFLLQSEEIIEVGSDESGLAGDADVEHGVEFINKKLYKGNVQCPNTV